MKTIAIFYFTIIATTIAVNLPDNFKVCKRLDPNVSKCLSNVVEEAIISLNNGLKSFEIMPLDPLKFMLKVNGTNLIPFKQEYNNAVIHGLTKRFKLHDFQINWNNSVMKFSTFHEQIDCYSDFKVEGQIIQLPIIAKGKFKGSSYNITTYNEINFETFERDKESFIRVKNYFIKISNKHVVMHFDNNNEGKNELLDKEINKFLNENSLWILKQLEPVVEKVMANIFLEISNKIFTRVPMNKIFPLA